MKKIMKPGLLSIVFAMILSGYGGSNASAQVTVSGTITYQTFYDNLSPYGTWIDYPGYGHVWNPKLDDDFRPYATNGYWVYSPDGWAWQSSYNWGWAPFHYGRWIYDDNYGWLWIPGYDWSPAWVTWGYVDNYYCWAPLMPGVNVNVQFGTWRPHSFYWNLCSRDHIYDRDISTRIERSERNENVVNRITIYNNFNTTRRNKLYYARGPEAKEVEGFTRQKINPVSFREVNKPNQATHKGNTVNVYRPAVQAPQQPREFRRAEPSEVKPIRTDDQRPSMQRPEQRNNIDRLPVHRASDNSNKNKPEFKPNKGNNPPGNKQGGKRNH
ncbi:MAG: hypothetical protein Q8941_23885 [Bacteroidota bacterium]|nr:hypothetical protein [Bacteroidota bacterium]